MSIVDKLSIQRRTIPNNLCADSEITARYPQKQVLTCLTNLWRYFRDKWLQKGPSGFQINFHLKPLGSGKGPIEKDDLSKVAVEENRLRIITADRVIVGTGHGITGTDSAEQAVSIERLGCA